MPSERKYNRSRSPVDDRTNDRKHDSRDRPRYSDSRNRDRSRDRHSRHRYDHRRPDDRLSSKHDSRYYDDRNSRSPRQHLSASASETSQSNRHRDSSQSGVGRAENGRTYDRDKDYGRLKNLEPETNLPRQQEDDLPGHENKKRRLEDEPAPMIASGSSSRRSRFDNPSSLQTESVAKTSGAAFSPILSGSSTKLVTDKPGSTTPTDKAVLSDAEKLRQRQERLAEWKRKKAEEAAKASRSNQAVTIDVVPSSKSSHATQKDVAQHVASNGFLARAAGPEQAKPAMSIGKFGISAKSTAGTTVGTNRKSNLQFDEEGKDRATEPASKSTARAMPTFDDIASDNLKQTPVATYSKAESEEEIDPLDAFMAENSHALGSASTRSRSAADVLNDQESEVEAGQSDEEDILAVAAKRAAAKKKDITTVDHAKQNYEDFRKDFYVEPAELANMSEEDVDALRMELDGIVIRGKDCPKPVMEWGQCGLSAATLEQIQRLGYNQPTSIQAQAIPVIMSGRDTIGVAKTGSGKTVAFLLPMFRHIKDQRPLESMEGPIAMILTPTRELAVQIHKECKPFLKALDLRAVCVYGGPPIKDQIAEFKRGAEIVVCTPGRMIDILTANQGRVTNLKRVTYTVLDEADRMFDLGFEPQVMKILNNIRPQRQTVLFSATFPKSMEALARKILRGKPIEITVGARSVVAPEIKQIVEVRPVDPDPQKFNRVLEILGELYNTDEDARTLIFVDRQEAADSLLAQLMRKGYPCNALHGGKDQYDRDSTISDFKAGIFPILVATSVAARGLDVKQLRLVINYDCPNHMEDYVHRVGRTGRAGNKGTAITFVGEDQERYAFDVAKALRLSQVEIPEALQKMADSFAAKVQSGQEKGTASGFGGKGLAKFDTARDKEKKIQRKIYGEEEDEEDEEMKKKLEAENAEEEDVDDDRVNPEEARAVAEMGTSAAADAPIRVEKISAQARQSSQAKPNIGTKALDPVAAARARIDAINNRIKTGTKPLEQVASNPDAGEYRAMMEINDYPQKARWNVTNRTNIAKVLEATGTSITTQGQYIKPGSTAPAGVPKLYLLVEGPTELCVTDAVKELRRLLSEGTLADAEASSTRYKVV